MLFRCGRRAESCPAPGVLALLLALALVASVPAVPARASSVLTLNPGLGLHTADRAVTIPVLAYSEGPDGEAVGHSLSFDTILIGRNPEPRIRVGLLEDVPGGVGPMSRPTGWLAAIMGARFAGVQLDEVSIAYDSTGFSDGPSDGLIRTIGVAAGLLGHELRKDVSITGTINPDGTVGPVGGIEQKIDAAAEYGYKTVLIPIGQRFEESDSGRVDLVAHGAKQGVQVREVGNFFEAYAITTGQDLRRSQPPTSMSTALPAPLADLWRTVYQKAFGRVQKLRDEIAALNQQVHPLVAQHLRASEKASAAGQLALALEYVERAERLALEQLITVQTRLERAVRRGDVRGMSEALDELRSALETTAEGIEELREDLEDMEPAGLSDVPWLLEAYGTLAEASVAASRGTAIIDAVDNTLSELRERGRVGRDDDALERAGEQLLRAAYWYGQAQGLLHQAVDRQELFLSMPGAGSQPASATLARYARIQLVGAYTTLEYFDRVELDDTARKAGVHVDVAQTNMVMADPTYALAYGLRDDLYPPDEDNLYGLLATAWRSYEINSLLIASYYNLDVEVDDVSSVDEDVLQYMLDWNAQQARAAIANARERDVEPYLSLALYEIGAGLRQGDVRDRLAALRYFWRAEFMARVMTDLVR